MLKKSADITVRDQHCYLTGELNFANVMSVYEKSLTYFMQHTVLHFNFSELISSNSAGLALIIEWKKLAARQGKSIHFLHLSPDLIALAQAAGLTEMIKH